MINKTIAFWEKDRVVIITGVYRMVAIKINFRQYELRIYFGKQLVDTVIVSIIKLATLIHRLKPINIFTEEEMPEEMVGKFDEEEEEDTQNENKEE